jgi:hypothetical protein
MMIAYGPPRKRGDDRGRRAAGLYGIQGDLAEFKKPLNILKRVIMNTILFISQS